jgi:hypothetical protein
MKDTHIRAILFIVIGVLCVAGAVALKLAGTQSVYGLMALSGVIAFGAAGYVLLFGG